VIQLILDDLSRVHVPSHWFPLLLLVLVIVSIALAADVYTSPHGIMGQSVRLCAVCYSHIDFQCHFIPVCRWSHTTCHFHPVFKFSLKIFASFCHVYDAAVVYSILFDCDVSQMMPIF